MVIRYSPPESRTEILQLFKEQARMMEAEVEVLGEKFSINAVQAEKECCRFFVSLRA